MYIHAGKNIIVSDKKIVGIFNKDTIILSNDNKRYFNKMSENDRTIIIDRDDNCITSNVNSYTVLGRTNLDVNYVWRRRNDTNL